MLNLSSMVVPAPIMPYMTALRRVRLGAASEGWPARASRAAAAVAAETARKSRRERGIGVPENNWAQAGGLCHLDFGLRQISLVLPEIATSGVGNGPNSRGSGTRDSLEVMA